MSAFRSRACGSIVLALVMFGGAAGPAQAADASIFVNPEVAFTEEPFGAKGRCPEGSESAVVSVAQGAKEVNRVVVDVPTDEPWATELDISSGVTGAATATVRCFAYAAADPLGTASTTFSIVAGSSEPYEVPVTVTPDRVPLGGSIVVTATCEPGTRTAVLFLSNEATEAPFAQEALTPAGDGSVRVRATVTGSHRPDLVDPVAGPADAQIQCGDFENLTGRTGFGTAPFTITAVPAPSTHRPRAAGAVLPELANTGPSSVALLPAAVALLVAGGALTSLGLRTNVTRRASRHPSP